MYVMLSVYLENILFLCFKRIPKNNHYLTKTSLAFFLLCFFVEATNRFSHTR